MARAWPASRAFAAAICLACLEGQPRAAPEGPAPGVADEQARAEESRLQRIRAEIEELRSRLQATEAKAGSVVDAIDEIDLRLALLAREAESLRSEERAAARRERAARRQAEELEQSLAASEGAARAVMRELAREGPARYLRLVALSASPSEFAAGRRAVEAMGLGEARRIADYRADRERLDGVLRDLSRARETLARLAGEIESRNLDLRTTKGRKEAVLAGLRRERASQEAALRELAQLEGEIQALVRKLQEAGEGAGAPSLGFARFRGFLAWPAAGRVIVPFGTQRHPRFGTQVPHPGIEIGAPPGQQVRAIFDGRVVFSAWFKGYGQMIVLDHGDGFVSIYAQVRERLVEAGRNVRQGDTIAASGDSGPSERPGLYFEIRHDGKPEDPAAWLSRGPGRTAAAPRGASPSRSLH